MARKASKKAVKVKKKATGRKTAAKQSGTKRSPKRKKAAGAAASKPAAQSRSGGSARVKLLSGGNPQIAKGDGDEVVQAYIAAMPGWKGDVGRRLDRLIVRTVPGVAKAVRWNSPFYGVPGQGWFLSYHCMTRYIKVTFFRGTSLRPVPPAASRHQEVRYFHIHEDDAIDEALLTSWIQQAAALPGEPYF